MSKATSGGGFSIVIIVLGWPIKYTDTCGVSKLTLMKDIPYLASPCINDWMSSTSDMAVGCDEIQYQWNLVQRQSQELMDLKISDLRRVRYSTSTPNEDTLPIYDRFSCYDLYSLRQHIALRGFDWNDVIHQLMWSRIFWRWFTHHRIPSSEFAFFFSTQPFLVPLFAPF